MSLSANSGRPVPFSAFLVDFMLGFGSTAAAKLVCAPIETLKLVYQAQSLPGHQERWGTVEALEKIVSRHGFFALWRGSLVNVMRYIPTQIFNIVSKDPIRKLFARRYSSSTVQFVNNLLSGAVAGTVSLLFVYPLDLAATLLTTDVGQPRRFNGFWHCLSTVLSKDGIFGLYPGFGVSILGIVAYRGTYFGLYDAFKPHPSSSIFKKFFFAQLVAIGAGLISYPFDTVRRAMMLQAGGQHLYNNSLDCLIKIVQQEGFLALWSGAFANILRTIGASFVLVIYDQFTQNLNK